jgi:hypothetical protein
MFPAPEEIQAGGRQVEHGVCPDAGAAAHQLDDPPLEHCAAAVPAIAPPRSELAAGLVGGTDPTASDEYVRAP